MELEAAVGRGRSKSGVVTISGLGVWTRKTNFRWPQVESVERQLLDFCTELGCPLAESRAASAEVPHSSHGSRRSVRI